MSKAYYTYILASQKKGTLYTGVTNDISRRVFEHKEKLTKGFTSKYEIDKLVYYEVFDDVSFAIARESQLKNWKRDWKIKLIEEHNPNWNDLYLTLNS